MHAVAMRESSRQLASGCETLILRVIHGLAARATFVQSSTYAIFL